MENTSDIADAGFDALLQKGFLKDLPAVGILFKSLDFAKNVHDRMFLAKVAKFLVSLSKKLIKIQNIRER